MNFKNRDILSIYDFSKKEMLHILETADNIKDQKELLKDNILATLFFEPSTRTRLSFESAMHRLGGRVIGFNDPSMTSVKKGETLSDTIKVVSGYCDVIAMRHPEVGSAKVAADATDIPIINAGDGSNQHPTQTFTDLYTIRNEKGTLNGLNVGFLGDLKYGRTVHSLAHALDLFGNKLYFISPKSLKMPDTHLKSLTNNYVEAERLKEVCKHLDVLYATRIQKERFEFLSDYEEVNGCFKLDNNTLKMAKEDIRIMHPLPRVGEIMHELDGSKQAVYFKQAHNGIPVRKALLSLVLGKT